MEAQLPFERIKRTIMFKREAETDPKYGKSLNKRTLKELLEYGVICVNKPSGPTSHLTSDSIKKILEVKKAGHGGTLDPAVTGVLPVALNRATRIMQTLLLAGKEYVCLMHIHKPALKKEIESTFEEFIGKIIQLPPVRSAVKRQERQREVYYIQILEILGQDVLFRIGTQAGTYIRKICSDFGKALGTGAHMAQLVRSKAGPFNDKEMYTLHDIKDAFTLYKQGKEKELKKMIKPLEFGISHLPKIWVLDSTVDALCHGATLKAPGIVKLETGIKRRATVAIYTLKDELIGFGEAKGKGEDMILEEKGVAVKLQTVIMERSTYPKNEH